MNKKLKELIKNKILKEKMNIDDSIEFIWNLKEDRNISLKQLKHPRIV